LPNYTTGEGITDTCRDPWYAYARGRGLRRGAHSRAIIEEIKKGE